MSNFPSVKAVKLHCLTQTIEAAIALRMLAKKIVIDSL
jgi:hypothetical protein